MYLLKPMYFMLGPKTLRHFFAGPCNIFCWNRPSASFSGTRRMDREGFRKSVLWGIPVLSKLPVHLLYGPPWTVSPCAIPAPGRPPVSRTRFDNNPTEQVNLAWYFPTINLTPSLFLAQLLITCLFYCPARESPTNQSELNLPK